jgi:hypothetical protein
MTPTPFGEYRLNAQGELYKLPDPDPAQTPAMFAEYRAGEDLWVWDNLQDGWIHR